MAKRVIAVFGDETALEKAMNALAEQGLAGDAHVVDTPGDISGGRFVIPLAGTNTVEPSVNELGAGLMAASSNSLVAGGDGDALDGARLDDAQVSFYRDALEGGAKLLVVHTDDPASIEALLRRHYPSNIATA